MRGRDEDRLNRASLAGLLAEQIARASGTGGIVFGLTGPWGSGKTSILNMVEEALGEEHERVLVVRFNPWLFSGTEQLVATFFEELASQFAEQEDERLKRVGKGLVRYGALLGPLRFLPAVGPWASAIEAASRGLGGFLEDRGQDAGPVSVRSRRRELDGELAGLDRKVLVVIDDMDRLGRDEVREVVKLVRLNADFPNVVYLLAFDRARVERALDEDWDAGSAGSGGRAYLEKIVQIQHEVPALRASDLTRMLTEGVNEILAGFEAADPPDPQDEHELANVFYSTIRPLFGTVRDVRRYLDVLPIALRMVGEEVATADVLALEAMRVLAPASFARLPSATEALTTIAPGHGGASSDALRQERRREIEDLIEAGGEHEDVVRETCRRLFPAAQAVLGNVHHGTDWLSRWRRERRVAHPAVLAFYLQKQLPEGQLPAREVRELFGAFADRGGLYALVEAMDPDALEHSLERLED